MNNAAYPDSPENLSQTKHHLPYDYCRCDDGQCPYRETCLRWMCRKSGHEMTPHFAETPRKGSTCVNRIPVMKETP